MYNGRNGQWLGAVPHFKLEIFSGLRRLNFPLKATQPSRGIAPSQMLHADR